MYLNQILNNCIAEFSSFSKNFSDKAPKPKSGLKDFLNMFDHQSKIDPSKPVDNEDDDTVIIGDYLRYEKKDELTTEGFYVNKMAQVKGNIIFTPTHLKFIPMKCEENQTVCLITIIINYD
jgi:hypothetical protein